MNETKTGRDAAAAEVTILAKTLDIVSIPARTAARPRKRPDRLIADRAYDSNAAREDMVRRGIEPIIPGRSNNRVATHQDGRKLRRYRRHWTIGRSIGWLFHLRGLVVRYERHVTIYTGLVHPACALIVMRVV